MSLEIGSTAPQFSMETDTDETITAANLCENQFILYFYPKDDTSGCTAEAIDFTSLLSDFEEIETKIIGVSPDTISKHKKFKSKHNLEITLASDPEKEVCQAYRVWVEKSMYGRKYMGVERSTFLIGKDGKIKQIWRKVKVKGHAEAVLAAAKQT